MRAYHEANKDATTLKGVKLNKNVKSPSELMMMTDTECFNDITQDDFDAWLKSSIKSCDAPTLSLMPLIDLNDDSADVAQSESTIGSRLRARKLGIDPPSAKNNFRHILSQQPQDAAGWAKIISDTVPQIAAEGGAKVISNTVPQIAAGGAQITHVPTVNGAVALMQFVFAPLKPRDPRMTLLAILAIAGIRPIRPILIAALHALYVKLVAWKDAKSIRLRAWLLTIMMRVRKLVCAIILRVGQQLLLTARAS